MIALEVSMHGANVLESLLVSEKQIRYAMSNAINATMLLIQKAERVQVHEDMTVRKSKFIERQIAVLKPTAKPQPGRLWAMIRIGQKPRLRLSEFQEGGTQNPMLGVNIAAPVTGGARPSRTQSVPQAMYLSHMRLQRVGASVRGHISAGGVFIIRDRGLFLRDGQDIRLLYAFMKTQVIQRRLHFYLVATGVASLNMPTLLAEQVTEAMNHTMARGAAGLTAWAIAGTAVARILGAAGGSAEEDDDLSFDDEN